MNKLTQSCVRSLFDYRNGDLYWKKSGKGRKTGLPAGSIRKDGYSHIGIDYKTHLSHRLIFLYHYGYSPEFLDHIDGNRLNNTITNLREATNQQNHMNMEKVKSINGKQTLSDYKGVSRDERREKWRSYINFNGKHKFLGYFDSEIEAALAYNKAAIELFGEFIRLNVIRGLIENG